MVNHPSEYRGADDCMVQDRPGAVAAIRTTGDWMTRSATDLVLRSVVEAMHMDRKRMAEALRSRIIMNEQPTGLDADTQMLVDQLLFDLADQIEAGTLGTPPS